MDALRSSIINGIDWPALPTPAAASRLAALFQFSQTQWWPQSKLVKHQFVQIAELLQHCVKHVPYYRELFAGRLAAGPLTEEQWHNIPILTRDKLQQVGDKLRAKTIPASHGKATSQRTSGSTGKPVETLSTDVNVFFWNVCTLRDHLWHKRDFSGKLAVIRHTQNKSATPPYGIRSENWGRATNGIFKTGTSVWINVHTPIAEQVIWLLSEKPDYLLTHPSVLQELALHCRRQSIQFPFLREVRTISEALPDGLRELCRDVWGVKLVDIYSTIELGILALQCPEHDHYHVQSEGVLLEVLDDNGMPCKPGKVGKVVVTNLHNFATPLIRYEVGDFAEVGEPCSCGRGLPVLKRILGRYRNLVVLPDGQRRWPKFGIGEILKIAPVRQYQAIQHTTHDVEFLLVMDIELSGEARKKLITLFRSNLHPEMNISVNVVDAIPRSASGKYEEFVTRL